MSVWRIRLCGMLWCCIVLHAGAALASEAQRLKDATETFAALDYEAALVEFSALTTEAETTEQRAEAWLWTGTCHAVLGDEASARAAFEQALALDPALTFTPRTSPKIKALFMDIKRQRPTPAVVPTIEAPSTPTAKTGPATTPPAASTPARAPASTLTDEPQAEATAPWPLVTAATGGGLAAVLAVGFVGFSAVQVAIANDQDTAQIQVQDHVDTANFSLMAAGVASGAALAIGAGTALWWWMERDDA